jgi:hypothetical protein
MVLFVNKPTVHVQVSFTVHQHATKVTNGIFLHVPEDTVVYTFLVLCLFICVFAFVIPQVPDNSLLSFTKNFSLQIWCNPESFSDEPGANTIMTFC